MERLKKEKQNQTQKEYDEYTQRKLEKRNNYTIEDRHILGKFAIISLLEEFWWNKSLAYNLTYLLYVYVPIEFALKLEVFSKNLRSIFRNKRKTVTCAN